VKHIIIALLSFLALSISVAKGEENQILTPPKVHSIKGVELIPTGYGLTKLLNKDYYLGRFSIDRDAVYRTPEDLIFIDAARRMEFKFVMDRKISGQTFSRKLAESMKINNEISALKDNIDLIKQFKGFFKRTIKKGDVLRFDYHPDFGTRVFLNKRLLGEISESREFYRFVLSTWLGERPPSAKFKFAILGQNGDDYAIKLQQQYESL